MTLNNWQWKNDISLYAECRIFIVRLNVVAPSEALLVKYRTAWPINIGAGENCFNSDKHASLFCQGKMNSCKMFYSTSPWLDGEPVFSEMKSVVGLINILRPYLKTVTK
jgi:hypothetical protein